MNQIFCDNGGLPPVPTISGGTYKPRVRVQRARGRPSAPLDMRRVSACFWLTTGPQMLGTAVPRTPEDEARDEVLGPMLGKRIEK